MLKGLIMTETVLWWKKFFRFSHHHTEIQENINFKQSHEEPQFAHRTFLFLCLEKNGKQSPPFSPQLDFSIISLSHSTTPLEIREKFHLDNNACSGFLLRLKEVLGIEEAFVLSTCNRTEIYHTGNTQLNSQVIALLCAEKALPATEYIAWFEIFTDSRECIQRLFEVSIGLHSKIAGDLQVASQVKTAYSLSNEQKMAGPFLHRLMHTIFHAGKRVQQETAWREGTASVSFAAAELAAELAGYHRNSSVLIIGAGDMGREVALNLKKENFSRFALANRTEATARNIAEQTGAELLSFEFLQSHVHEFDIVIICIHAETPILSADSFASKEPHKTQFFIDLSVPRAIHPSVDNIPGVVLFSLDEITKKTDEATEKRLAAIPAVQEIIAEEIARFLQWSNEMEISPAIQKLKEALENIRKEEMARFLKNASATETELVDKITGSMINKILRLPVVQLKNACMRGEQENLMEALVDLFDLEKGVKNKA